MFARLQEGKVLVPWDFSEQSLCALRTALAISGGDSSQIRALHVSPPLSEPYSTVASDSGEKSKTLELNSKFREEVCDVEFQSIEFHVSFGDVAHEIVQFADDHKVSIIVIASHDRTGLSRFLFGGLPELIVRSAKCPVLVVPEDYESDDRLESLSGQQQEDSPTES